MNIILTIIRIILSPFAHICGRVMYYHQRDIAQDIYVSNKEKGWFSNKEDTHHNHSSTPCIPGHISCFSCCSREDNEENVNLIGHTDYV